MALINSIFVAIMLQVNIVLTYVHIHVCAQVYATCVRLSIANYKVVHFTQTQTHTHTNRSIPTCIYSTMIHQLQEEQ